VSELMVNGSAGRWRCVVLDVLPCHEVLLAQILMSRNPMSPHCCCFHCCMPPPLDNSQYNANYQLFSATNKIPYSKLIQNCSVLSNLGANAPSSKQWERFQRQTLEKVNYPNAFSGLECPKIDISWSFIQNPLEEITALPHPPEK